MEQKERQITCEVVPVLNEPLGVNADEKTGVRKTLFTKKNMTVTGIAAGVLLAAAGAAYGKKAERYKDHFLENTVINGIDVSELTLQEAEELVKNQVESYRLSITFPDASEQTIKGEAIELAYIADDQLWNILSEQKTMAWGLAHLGASSEATVDPSYSYDSELLREALRSLPAFQEENITDSEDAYLKYSKETKVFEVIPQVYGNRHDEEAVLEQLIQAVDEYGSAVTLDDSTYIKPEISSDDSELNAEMEALNDFLSTRITIDLHDGSKFRIGSKRLYQWLKKENGHYIIDEEQIREKTAEAAAEIAEKDDELCTTLSFESTLSGTVEVPCSTYGWIVDQEAEAEQLYQEIMAREEVTRKPNYSREDPIEIGDTYVEVDIPNQEVFVYIDGEVVVDVLCVSGTDVSSERRSDRGLFYIYKKLKNHTMKGPIDKATGKPSYESHTNFATYYNKGEAFHDASWRSRFGGTTYIYSGSHGCINMSYNSAKAIYENTEIGMPVLVFGSTKH